MLKMTSSPLSKPMQQFTDLFVQRHSNVILYFTYFPWSPWRVTFNLRPRRVLEGKDHVRHLLASQSQNIFRRLNFQFFVQITIFMWFFSIGFFSCEYSVKIFCDRYSTVFVSQVSILYLFLRWVFCFSQVSILYFFSGEYSVIFSGEYSVF